MADICDPGIHPAAGCPTTDEQALMSKTEHPDLSLETGLDEWSEWITQSVSLLQTYTQQIEQGDFAPYRDIDVEALAGLASMTAAEPPDSEGLWQLLTQGFNANHPGYMADIPGGGLLWSALGELLTSGFNRWPGLYPGAPGLLEIEKSTLSWMCRLFGMQENAVGFFTSGGSMANFSAVHIARVQHLDASTVSCARIYTSDQCHHSVTKAARMAGFYDHQIVVLPSDSMGRIHLQSLSAQLATDRDNAQQPFLLVASAGTTRTGAVDDLMALRQLADDYGCWLHVDAAWAGSFMLTERGQALMTGIGAADSITIDPHKAFWTTWGSGALLVNEAATLKPAFDVDADYLPFADADELMLNPSIISPELSRNARGLQLWLPLRLAGEQAFVNCLNEKLDLCEQAADALTRVAGLTVADWPLLGICCFAFEGGQPDEDIDRINQQTQALIDRVNQDGRVVISGAHLHGRLYARLAPLQFKTHKQHVDVAVDLIADAACALLAEQVS